MGDRILVFFSHFLALLFGFLAGFFLVFNSVFSDVFTWQDRVLFTLIVWAAYMILGFLFGLLFPGKGWRWGIWLSAFALFVLFFYILSALVTLDPWFFFVLFYAASIFGIASTASHLGAKLRRPRQPLAEE